MGRPKRQPDLPEMTGPGVEKPSYPDIDKAADKFFDRHQERLDAGKAEKEARNKLVEAMKAYGQEHYEYVDGETVRVVDLSKSEEKVTVKEKAAHEEGELTPTVHDEAEEG
jgi:hypothetical protein